MPNQEEAQFGHVRVSGPVSDIPLASRMLTLAEDTYARQRGFTVEEARIEFARNLKVPPRTLLHIRKKRSKSVAHFLMTGIRNTLIRVLEKEIRSLEHEIAIARTVGSDYREDAMEQACASISEARAFLAAAVASRRTGLEPRGRA